MRLVFYNLLVAGTSLAGGYLFAQLDPLFGWQSWPGRELPIVGLVVVLAGFMSRMLAHREFERAKLTIFAISGQTTFTQNGIYYYSRNPFYVGLVLQQVGAALIWQSPSALFAAGLYFLFWHIFLLVIEEPSLRARFGSGYTRYQQITPRWLGFGRSLK